MTVWLCVAVSGERASASIAADCAAFWRGVAAEQRAMPGLGISPETAETLARSFEALAPPDADADANIAERISGYRLLYRGRIDGDRQSSALFRRISQRCDALLAEQAAPSS